MDFFNSIEMYFLIVILSILNLILGFKPELFTSNEERIEKLKTRKIPAIILGCLMLFLYIPRIIAYYS